MLVDIGKGFLSKLVDSTYDSARRLAKDKLEKDRITDTVTSHFEKMAYLFSRLWKTEVKKQ